jgi:hypothetical protein
MLNVVMLNVVMLNVVMLNVIMLNVDMLNVIMLNVIMLNVIMLNFVIMNVNMLNIVMLNVVMLNVVAPIKDRHLKARFRRLHFLDLLVDSANLFLDPVVQLQLERDDLSAVSYTLFLHARGRSCPS